MTSHQIHTLAQLHHTTRQQIDAPLQTECTTCRLSPAPNPPTLAPSPHSLYNPRMSSPTESANRMIWNHQSGHYEVWYLTFNHRPSQSGFWLRYTLTAPRHADPYAKLWFAYFNALHPERSFALNRRYAIDAFHTSAEPFSVQIGDARLWHGGSKGAIAGNGHQAIWDFTFPPSATVHHQLP